MIRIGQFFCVIRREFVELSQDKVLYLRYNFDNRCQLEEKADA